MRSSCQHIYLFIHMLSFHSTGVSAYRPAVHKLDTRVNQGLLMIDAWSHNPLEGERQERHAIQAVCMADRSWDDK